jgi:hypothetical protein
VIVYARPDRATFLEVPMTRTALVLGIALGIGCTAPVGSFKGRLVGGLDGQPKADVELLMKAQPLPPNPACHQLTIKSGADGSFEIAGLCDKADYALSAKDPALFVVAPPPTKGGVMATASVDVAVWPVPTEPGVYIATADQMLSQRASTEVGTLKVWESDQTVRYPVTIPENPPNVNAGQTIVLSGERAISEYKFFPLIESGERKFGTKAEPEKSEPWSYVGVRFASDTEFERVEGQLAEGKYTDIGDGKLRYRFIQHDALAAGRYALLADKGKRMYIFDIGIEDAPVPAPAE